MNKTPVGQQYVCRLTLINDQLCCSALAHDEIAKTIAPYAKDDPICMALARMARPLSSVSTRSAETIASRMTTSGTCATPLSDPLPR